MPLALARKASSAPPKIIESFADLGVSQSYGLIDALQAMAVPMESQKLAWSPVRETDQDLALISEAGSGKARHT